MHQDLSREIWARIENLPTDLRRRVLQYLGYRFLGFRSLHQLVADTETDTGQKVSRSTVTKTIGHVIAEIEEFMNPVKPISKKLENIIMGYTALRRQRQIILVALIELNHTSPVAEIAELTGEKLSAVSKGLPVGAKKLCPGTSFSNRTKYKNNAHGLNYITVDASGVTREHHAMVGDYKHIEHTSKTTHAFTQQHQAKIDAKEYYDSLPNAKEHIKAVNEHLKT